MRSLDCIRLATRYSEIDNITWSKIESRGDAEKTAFSHTIDADAADEEPWASWMIHCVWDRPNRNNVDRQPYRWVLYVRTLRDISKDISMNDGLATIKDRLLDFCDQIDGSWGECKTATQRTFSNPPVELWFSEARDAEDALRLAMQAVSDLIKCPIPMSVFPEYPVDEKLIEEMVA